MDVDGLTRSAVEFYQVVSERIICMRIKPMPVGLLIIQVYASTSDATQEEVEELYKQIDLAMTINKKYRDYLIIMGDFNGKVGNMRGDIVGPHGLGQRTKNGQYNIDCCHKHNLSLF